MDFVPKSSVFCHDHIVTGMGKTCLNVKKIKLSLKMFTNCDSDNHKDTVLICSRYSAAFTVLSHHDQNKSIYTAMMLCPKRVESTICGMYT